MRLPSTSLLASLRYIRKLQESFIHGNHYIIRFSSQSTRRIPVNTYQSHRSISRIASPRYVFSRQISVVAQEVIKKPRKYKKNRRKKHRLTRGNAIKRSRKNMWLRREARKDKEEAISAQRERLPIKSEPLIKRDENVPQKTLGDQRVRAANPNAVYCELHRLRNTGRELSTSTYEAIARWFKSDTAAKVYEREPPKLQDIQEAMEMNGVWHGLGWIGRGRWNVESSSISEDGVCKKCGEKLATYNLRQEDESEFMDRIVGLARKSVHRLKFDIFHDWVDLSEPLDVVVDGESLRKCFIDSKNKYIMRASFHDILKSAVFELQMHSLRFLIVLDHESAHANASSPAPDAKLFLYNLRCRKELYTVTRSVDPSWFCLYAAAKHKCLLVTNNNFEKPLRIFSKRFMPKWIERHQARFLLPIRYIWPPSYSVTIQESANGSWHIPSTIDKDIVKPRTWLCIRRSGKQSL